MVPPPARDEEQLHGAVSPRLALQQDETARDLAAVQEKQELEEAIERAQQEMQQLMQLLKYSLELLQLLQLLRENWFLGSCLLQQVLKVLLGS